MTDTGLGCQMGQGIAVCSPRGFRYRTVSWCPYCKARTRHLITTFEWYGPEVECGRCGTEWSDHYRRRLTNKAKAINRHGFHERWTATEGNRADARRWLMARLTRYQEEAG